jgi:hypothetical protein
VSGKILLVVDGVVNLGLGVLLLLYSPALAKAVGVPLTDSAFYPNILGAVFVGIAIALLVEAFRKSAGRVGLGTVGAALINLCGAVVLAIWLIRGGLELPLRGWVLLGALDALLIVIASGELVATLVLGRRPRG